MRGVSSACLPSSLNRFCNDWLLRNYERTFGPFHRGVVTGYALEVGAAGQGDNRDPSFPAFGAVRDRIHEIPPDFLPLTRNCNFCSIRASRARDRGAALAGARSVDEERISATGPGRRGPILVRPRILSSRSMRPSCGCEL